jgi:hypothetical protein
MMTDQKTTNLAQAVCNCYVRSDVVHNNVKCSLYGNLARDEQAKKALLNPSLNVIMDTHYGDCTLELRG